MTPPRVRADCIEGGPLAVRPCPWTACRHSLPGGRCTLDLVSQNPDGMTLAQVAQVFDLTRERVRQIEEHALRLVHFRAHALKLTELLPEHDVRPALVTLRRSA